MAIQDTLDQLQDFDLNDLDVNNIGAWPSAVKFIAMVLLFALVLGIGYYVHVKDKQTQLERVEAKEVDLRKEYE